MLNALIQERVQHTPEQIAFWQGAHGDDWEQVVEADTNLMRRFAEHGGDWFGSRLGDVQCPVLLTASMRDTALPRVTHRNCRMAEQIPDCRLYLHNKGGHPLMWSQPETFRAVADQFLRAIK
jgi:pimeloyl-ACP methyl ester carboxylesterase